MFEMPDILQLFFEMTLCMKHDLAVSKVTLCGRTGMQRAEIAPNQSGYV